MGFEVVSNYKDKEKQHRWEREYYLKHREEILAYKRKNKPTPQAVSARRNKASASLRAQFGGKCMECCSTRRLVFAHLEPTPILLKAKRGWPYGIRKDVLTHPRCYTLWCSACHNKFGGPERPGFTIQPYWRLHGRFSKSHEANQTSKQS